MITPSHRLLLASALLVAACGNPGGAAEEITYTDPGNLSLVRIPGEWNLYEPEELTGLGEVPFVESVQGLEFPPVATVGFDGAPVHDPANLRTQIVEADYPIGAATVRTVGESERDFISRFVLTQAVIPYRSFGTPQEITKEDFTFGDGWDGVRVLVAFTDETGREVGVAYLISVTDPGQSRMYSVVAGCSRECFVANQETIEEVVDSWLVNKRA